MSLFKSREWWSANCGVNETFGAFNMCIANYESTSNGLIKQLIIVGSIEGYLRIFDPQPLSSETTCSSDLQLETQLALPILAVETGRFNNTEGLRVAVLHPKHLRILRVAINEHSGANSYCTVDFMYEHTFTPPLHGYTLTVGPSWLCVQSLTDGILMFFENERAGVTCKLPTLNLLPSPICYVPSTESFILCDSSWNLQSYNYQSLANSTLDQQASRTPSAPNKLVSDWEIEMGEPAIDIQTTGSYIVILTERHLYCLKDNGDVMWTRKLDYHPVCCSALVPPDSPDSVVILVCTDAKTLLVYQDNIVQWNCKLPFTPLVIKIATLQNIQGLAVTLSDVGQLNVSYMGTQQVQYGFLQAPQRPLNYDRGGLNEIQQLTQSLKIGKLKDSPKETEMTLDLKLDPYTSPHYLENYQMVDAVKGMLKISMPKNPNGNVHVFFRNDPLIIATPSDASLDLDREGQAELPILFHPVPLGSATVASLLVEVSAITQQTGSSSTTRYFNLPLHLVTKLSKPVREALVKITLSTNQPAVNLAHLFRDFNVDDASMANVIALAHLNGTIVSILVSKTTNKYRLQSDSLPALVLLVVELQRRLQFHFVDSNDFEIGLDSALPVQELWNQVESHYITYTNLQREMLKLGQATRQFQIIQRVFHNKILNTKTANLIQGTFSALQLAHDHVTFCIEKVERLQEAFKNVTHLLGGSVLCVISLLNLGNCNEKKRMTNLIEKALLPIEQMDMDKPWQQTVEAKLNYLLRQRSFNPTTSSTAAPNSEKEFNLSHFKKVFLQALDMLIKDPQP